MRKHFGKIAAIIMSVAMLGSSMAPALAAEVDAAEIPESVVAEDNASYEVGPDGLITESAIMVNPVYEGIIEPDEHLLDDIAPSNEEGRNVYMAEGEISYADAIKKVRNAMINREENCVFTTTLPSTNNILNMIFTDACADNSTSVAGDYLRYHTLEWGARWSYYSSSGPYTITMRFHYSSTAAQEQAVTNSLRNTYSNLGLADCSNNFDKIYKIYEYMTDNITYNYPAANTGDTYGYATAWSAYGAEVEHYCVCQGYAVLFYRMCYENGIWTRVITGKGNGDNHAWNIVKINNQWYNVDATWDAESYYWNYFLRSNGNFGGHSRDYEYNNSEFNNKYPMSSTNFDMDSYTGDVEDPDGKPGDNAPTPDPTPAPNPTPSPDPAPTPSRIVAIPLWQVDGSTHNKFAEFNGKYYWYEHGVRQGTYDDPHGVMGDGTVRGREICDMQSQGWYWLDSVYDGATARNKEVWMPYIYQQEKSWGEAEIKQNALASGNMAAQVERDIKAGTGKWVRYDANGAMFKGWYTVDDTQKQYYPAEQHGKTYYYDPKTGLMAKGTTVIDGISYYFHEIDGYLIQ